MNMIDMEVDRVQVKLNAKNALKNHYGPIIGWSVLAMVIMSAAAIPGIGPLAAVILVPLMVYGLAQFYYRAYRLQKPGLPELSSGFNDFGRALGGYWWMMLFSVLWLIVPVYGIVKVISYSMTPFILADRPEYGAKDALKLSMAMTYGHRWELFVMGLSFFGWILLSALTAGILAVLYVFPYIMLTLSGYYDTLKAAYEMGSASEAF